MQIGNSRTRNDDEVPQEVRRLLNHAANRRSTLETLRLSSDTRGLSSAKLEGLSR
jgi:phage head maturation protease